MVANDSGPLHIAQAVGTPTVGIYSFFNLMNFGPITRARHHPVISQCQSPGACAARCGDCDDCRSYLTDIPVDDVLAAAMALWEAARDSSTHRLPWGLTSVSVRQGRSGPGMESTPGRLPLCGGSAWRCRSHRAGAADRHRGQSLRRVHHRSVA